MNEYVDKVFYDEVDALETMPNLTTTIGVQELATLRAQLADAVETLDWYRKNTMIGVKARDCLKRIKAKEVA